MYVGKQSDVRKKRRGYARQGTLRKMQEAKARSENGRENEKEREK
jgi:hypothetical protein